MTQAALALVLLLAGPAPLTISSEGFAVAPVSLNGQGPYLLIVDTAAGATAIFPSLAKALGLSEAGDSQVSVQGASGVRRVAQHRLGPVSVGSATVESLGAVSLDASHLFGAEGEGPLGVLGADFLLAFDVEMDFPRGLLTLEAPAVNAPVGATSFSFLFGRFLLVPARVNGAAVTAVVDTGARRTILNGLAARAAGLEVGDERLQRDEPVRGATADTTEAWSFRAGSVEAAGASWRGARLGVADLPVFAALGLDEEPAMILGVNLLEGRLLRIDYDERRLLIAEAARSGD